jgi:hypothetical protein
MDVKKLSMLRIAMLIFSLGAGSSVKAQDSLLSMLEDSAAGGNVSFPVKGTFKGLHLINAQTIESPAKKDLNFIIMHRFGQLNEGAYAFFGLDNAFIRLGLDYGITDRLAVGIGRSSLEKTFDGYLKYKLLQQTSGKKNIPVSISLLTAIANYTLRMPQKEFLNAKFRTTYTTQLLIAKKFTEALSLQLSPTWMHFNMVPTRNDNNDVLAAMIGGRLKFTKRMSLTAEYNYLLPDQVESLNLTNSLSLGVDIETGGHVFQLVFSNSRGMIEPQYIARTNGEWSDGDIFFGFNISRNFSFSKKEKKQKGAW